MSWQGEFRRKAVRWECVRCFSKHSHAPLGYAYERQTKGQERACFICGVKTFWKTVVMARKPNA